MAKRSMVSKAKNYYCVCVRRDYETVCRCVSKHDTREEAEAEIERRRGFSGLFNYDNAELWIMSRTEAKKQFGKDWEFKPIGHSAKRTVSEA